MDNNNKTGAFWQAIATIVIWFMVMGGIALGSVFLVPKMGEEALGFFFMLFVAAVVCTGFVWDWGQLPDDGRRRERHDKQKNEAFDTGYDYDEKRKHDRLANALKTLADDDLIRIRERIARGDIGEEELASMFEIDDRR